MESMFAETHGVIEEINGLFVQYERSLNHPEVSEIESTISNKLDGLNKNFDRLEVYIMKEQPNRRQAPRLKLNQLKYDVQHLTASLRIFKNKRFQKERELVEREELLSRRHTANTQAPATSIYIDGSMQHNTSLQNASRGIDDLLGQGYEALTNLRGQREMLKATRTKMLNFLNTLGLSNTVMNLIERRASQDKFVLFAGMLITLSIMFFIYMYFT